MKKNNYCLVFSILALILSSCSADEDSNPSNNQITNSSIKVKSITADIEDRNITRACLGGDSEGYNAVKWTDNDCIGIYNTSSVVKYQIADKQMQDGQSSVKDISANGKSAQFVPVEGDGITGRLSAYYPYDNVTKNGTTLSINIPSDQTPKNFEGKTDFFNPAYQFMTGFSEDGKKLTFYNQLALLRITISANLASAIKVVAAKNGNDLTYLSGTVNATVNSDNTVVSLDEKNRSTFVEARASSGYLPAGTYYFAVVPNNNQGFTILIEDWQNNKAYQRVNNSTIIKKNNLYDLGSYDSSNVTFVENVVDLGLPTGTLWCTHNVGATSPTEKGGYYAWGETEEQTTTYKLGQTGLIKTNYVWDSYKFGRSSDISFVNRFSIANQGSLMRYNSNTSYQRTLNTYNTKFRVDNQTTLAIEDDAANSNMGAKWTIPSYSQMNELITYCTITKSDNNFVITSTKYTNKSITLPIGGYKEDNQIQSSSEAHYWTKTRSTNTGYDFMANRLKLSTNWINNNISKSLEGESRAQGRMIRAVLRNSKIAPTYSYQSEIQVTSDGETYTLQSLWNFYEDNKPKLTPAK